VDVGSAFMRALITHDVKHKWVKLDKRVIEMVMDLLLELEYDKYKDYVVPDCTLIVEMDKLSYGYVEPAHYWYESHAKTFTLNNHEVSGKDKCMFIKCQDINVTFLCNGTG
jgi:hypothetical protein